MTGTPSPADRKADYARRADQVTYAFVYGNDWQRLAEVWELYRHHGWRLTWPVLVDGLRRALEVGPNITWHHPPTRNRNTERK